MKTDVIKDINSHGILILVIGIILYIILFNINLYIIKQETQMEEIHIGDPVDEKCYEQSGNLTYSFFNVTTREVTYADSGKPVMNVIPCE